MHEINHDFALLPSVCCLENMLHNIIYGIVTVNRKKRKEKEEEEEKRKKERKEK